jgi:hypothetical protein
MADQKKLKAKEVVSGTISLVLLFIYLRKGGFSNDFDKVQLDELFRAWEVNYINEYEMGRYKNSKMLWEIAVRKA